MAGVRHLQPRLVATAMPALLIAHLENSACPVSCRKQYIDYWNIACGLFFIRSLDLKLLPLLVASDITSVIVSLVDANMNIEYTAR